MNLELEKVQTNDLTFDPSITIPEVIESHEQYEDVLFKQKRVNAHVKSIKERKDALLSGVKKAERDIKLLFEPFEKPVNELNTKIKSVLIKYANEMNRKAQEEADRIARDKRLKNPEVVHEKMQAVEAMKVAGTRKVKKVKITDINSIPDKYWIVDEVALRADLIAGVKILGATIVEEVTLSGR